MTHTDADRERAQAAWETRKATHNPQNHWRRDHAIVLKDEFIAGYLSALSPAPPEGEIRGEEYNTYVEQRLAAFCGYLEDRTPTEATTRVYRHIENPDWRDAALQADISAAIMHIAKLEASRSPSPPMEGFHWTEGCFFHRLADGSVRVRKHASALPDAPIVSEAFIPAAEWASIVCSVSAEGETGERWNAAQDFHGRPSSADAAGQTGGGE